MTPPIPFGMCLVKSSYHPKFTPALNSIYGVCWAKDSFGKEYSLAPLAQAQTIRDLATKHRKNVSISLPSPKWKTEKNKDRLEAALNTLSTSGLELLPHQREAIQRAYISGALLVAVEMGGGKCAIALRSILATGASRSIIITPSNVKYEWVDEAKEWLPGINLIIYETGEQVSQLTIPPDSIAVVSWSLAHLLPDSSVFDAIILDEVHKASNYKSKQTKAITALTSRCPSALRLGLSGTPEADSEASDSELSLGGGDTIFTVLSSLFPGPKQDSDSYPLGPGPLGLPNKFRQTFMLRERIEFIDKDIYKGYNPSTSKELQKLLAQLVYFIRADDPILAPYLCHPNISVTYKDVELAIPGSTPDFENEDAFNELLLSQVHAVAEALKGALTPGLKVVASHHHKTNEFLHRTLGLKDDVTFNGSVPPKERKNLIKQASDLNSTIFLTIGSACEGINTLKHIPNVFIVEIPFKRYQLPQFMGRFRRLGQSSPANIHFVFPRDSISAQTFRAVLAKSEGAEQLLGATALERQVIKACEEPLEDFQVRLRETYNKAKSLEEMF